MLIITKKKDYYDGVVGTMGVDKTIIYDRNVTEFSKDDIPMPFKRIRSNYYFKQVPCFLKLGGYNLKKEYYKTIHNYSYFIIGFCGKLYIGWKLYHKNKNNEVITEYLYDTNSFKNILDSNKSWHGNIDDHINNILNYDAMPFFRGFNTPVFIYDNDYNRTVMNKYGGNENPVFIVNPLLSNYEFYRVFDSFQAFQEIQMFLSGVLGNHEKEIVEVADKYKIEQHGFDKWSFRKEKNE